MTEKEEMQDLAFRVSEANGVEWYHIPNRVFKDRKLKDRSDGGKLKSKPDCSFMWRRTFYMREFGLPGTHKKRKDEQRACMARWAAQGADVGVVETRGELVRFFLKIGLCHVGECV